MDVLTAWGIEDAEVRPVGLGTNNTSYFVGDEFVLRVHQNSVSPAYEHALLRELGGLSFAVPEPVPTKDGRTSVRLGDRLASLCRRIPGEHPKRGNARQAEACGRALAELDVALADLADLPPGKVWNGDLERVHPLVRSLADLLDELPARSRAGVAAILERIRPRDDLPRQVVHGDFGTTNVLMVGEGVTGILDFEFAGPAYRAMDLAAGLWAFGRDEWSTPKPWPISDAFRFGYLTRHPLTDIELDALPWLQMLREATSFVHWCGRYRGGLASYGELRGRVDRLLGQAQLLDW